MPKFSVIVTVHNAAAIHGYIHTRTNKWQNT